jgi:hypothetical protein
MLRKRPCLTVVVLEIPKGCSLQPLCHRPGW